MLNQTTENIGVGGIAFLVHYLAVYLPYSIGTIIATIVGLTGFIDYILALIKSTFLLLLYI